MNAPSAAPDRKLSWTRLADGLAAAVAISLPWSTSATIILVPLWFLASLLTFDYAAVRREVLTPAGGLPLLLAGLGLVGMLWSDATFADKLSGFDSFYRLFAIPLLLAQFRRSENVAWAIYGFFGSALLLLVASWLFLVIPALRDSVSNPGVPVKDYISQSGVFQLCIFALLFVATERPLRPRRAAALIALALVFLADIAYVASSRTAFVVMPILLLLLGLKRFGWRGLLGACLVGALLAGVLWELSPYMRTRLGNVVQEAMHDPSDAHQTSAGQRVEFWRKSMQFVVEAPLFGHGTGSIKPLFRKAAEGDTGAAAVAAGNPHQQTFAVAIQLGLLGAGVLWALWLSHLWLFRGQGLMAWLGFLVVVQNVVGSLFNSHLFDFTQGWLYVFGVGILGGAVLRESDAAGSYKSPPR